MDRIEQIARIIDPSAFKGEELTQINPHGFRIEKDDVFAAKSKAHHIEILFVSEVEND